VVDANYLMQGLVQRGLPPHVAQGFVMNMRDESGLNPGINEVAPTVPGSRGGFGLYQLTGPRRRAYEAFAQERGVNVADPDAQLDFLMTELQGPESRAAQSIFATENPQDAAVAIARDFLRPAPENLQKRVAQYTGGTNMARQPQPVSGTPTISTQGRAAPQAEEEKVPFFQRPGVGNALDSLAIALQGMTINPNQGLMQLSANRIQGRREAQQTKAQQNRTLEALKNMGAPPQIIQMAEAGYGREAMSQMAQMARGETVKGVEIGDRLVNPVTGEVIADFSQQGTQFDPEDISKARKEFTGLKPVKDFADQTAAYGRIISSIENPSPAGDLALIFNYMKVLDPGSTVREGEFATAEQAGGVDARVRGLYNRVVSGERLTPEQRSDFANRATRLYQGAEQQYQTLADQYAGFARAAGLPVEQVIPDFSFSGQIYETPLEFQVPPPPAGIAPEQWSQAWQSMTDEERRQFISEAQ